MSTANALEYGHVPLGCKFTIFTCETDPSLRDIPLTPAMLSTGWLRDGSTSFCPRLIVALLSASVVPCIGPRLFCRTTVLLTTGERFKFNVLISLAAMFNACLIFAKLSRNPCELLSCPEIGYSVSILPL